MLFGRHTCGVHDTLCWMRISGPRKKRNLGVEVKTIHRYRQYKRACRAALKGYGQLISTRHQLRGRVVWFSNHSARGSYSGYANSISISASGCSGDSECRRWAQGFEHPHSPGDAADVTDMRAPGDDNTTSGGDDMLTRCLPR